MASRLLVRELVVILSLSLSLSLSLESFTLSMLRRYSRTSDLGSMEALGRKTRISIFENDPVLIPISTVITRPTLDNETRMSGVSRVTA